MTTDELKKKIDDQVRELQETGAKAYAARTAAEKRKQKELPNREADKYLAERIKKDAGQNSNNDIEKGEKPPFTPLFRNNDEIIDNGAFWEAVYLYICNADFWQAYGLRKLTEEQEQRITKRVLSSKERREEAGLYVSTYNAFLQYGKVLSIYQAEYQREAARLTGLIKLMETVQDSKQDLLFFHETFVNNDINGAPEVVCRARLTLAQSKEKSILAQIKQQAKRTEEALKHLKNYIEPLFDYIYNRSKPPLWPLMPVRVENILEYPDSIPEQNDPKMEKYFRYRLRQRREKGETITPEEEAIAYYPDYNELKENKAEVKQAKEQILEIFKLWEVSHEAKKRKR